MLESYLLTTDGKDYVDVDCVREALGVVDEYVDIFGVIKKLKEERDGLKAELELTNRLYKEDRNFIEKLCDAVDIQRPYLESGYANAVRLITGFKKERDELKEKCDKLKKRANALYGASCGYSASKEPAFRCNVISYSWEFGSMLNRDSIRVELELTPNANYKGTFDMEDLKRYIQEYGREKKLSDFEIFCKLVNNCIDELCDKYVVVKPDDSQITRERLDYIFAVLAENRERYNSEWKRVEELKKEKRTIVDSLAELRAKIREIYRSIVDDEWNSLSYTSALNDINEEYKRVVHKLKDDGCNAEKEFLDAVKKRIGVSADCSDNAYMPRLLDIKLDHSALSTFTDNVYKELGLPRYGYTLTETIYNLKNRLDCDARLRSNICTALGLGGETSKNSNSDIINRVIEIRESHEKLCKDYTELRKAIWEAMDRNPETLPEEDARLVGEVRMLQLNYVPLKRLHDEVAKVIGMNYPVTNNDIVNRVKNLYDANESNHDVISDLNRQVTELKHGEKLLIEFRDDVAKAIGMTYPTTNQVILHNVKYIYKDREDAYGMVAKLNDQVTALEKAKEDLQQILIASRYGSLEDPQRDLSELRKNAIEELKSRGFLFRPEEDETLTEIYAKLLKRYDWTYRSYKEQHRLRQMWHLRWESENERANGEHKRAEKLRKEVTALANHVELLKLSNASQANSVVASQAFKNECRKLKEEKTKVISALGQDIWDDCLKD